MTGMGIKTRLTDMSFDEVSLVRRPANQHAAIVFSKADEGGAMPGTLVTEDGVEIDIDDLEVGTEVRLDDGESYVVVEEDGPEGYYDDFDDDGDGEYGKSADFAKSLEDYSELVAKAYTEAVTDDERAVVLSEIAKAAAAADARATAADAAIAKMHVDAYLDECIAKADEYGFAGERTVMLGEVIAKAMTVLDDDEIQLLDDIMKSFSELVYEDALGTEAYGGSDVMDLVGSAAGEIIEKSGGEVTAEQAMAMAFESNPDLYAMYLDEKAV